MFKRMTADEAALLIKDGDQICFNGQVRIAVAERFYKAIGDRFAATGSPKNLKYLASSSYDAFNTWAPYQHSGLISEIIVAHFIAIRPFHPAILDGTVKAYSLPQGVLAMNYSAGAMGHPGFLTKVGIGTIYDPRNEKGCGFNDQSTRKFAEVMEIHGEEYLFFQTILPDVCVIRGTTCDPHGNITMEKEAGVMDTLSLAMATHNHGGTVIVQVERFSDQPANPHDVKVPGYLVDAVYDDPDQIMNDESQYDPVLSGETHLSEEAFAAKVKTIHQTLLNSRKPVDRFIARRAAMEMEKGTIINLGVGVPMLLACEAFDMGYMDTSNIISLECGVAGGMPLGYSFGSVVNADVFMEQSDMFRFYEGHGIDATCVGALEIDRAGNVNVIRKGKNLIGVGGFNHVTYGPHKVLVTSTFEVSSSLAYEDGKPIVKDGKLPKFCEQVEFINLSAEQALKNGQEVLYITERCVFRLTAEGVELTEIAPGLDLDAHILSKLPFTPKISPNLKEMPKECFVF